MPKIPLGLVDHFGVEFLAKRLVLTGSPRYAGQLCPIRR
jgi:hypothetical protein